MSAAPEGGAKVIDGHKGGRNRLGPYTKERGDRIPLHAGRPAVILSQTKTYSARLVAPKPSARRGKRDRKYNYRWGGDVAVSFFNKGNPIGPFWMMRPVTPKMRQQMRTAGVRVEITRVGKGKKVRRVTFRIGGDRISRDVNPDGSLGALVLTDHDHRMTRGVCIGGRKAYFAAIKHSVGIKGRGGRSRWSKTAVQPDVDLFNI